MPVRVQLEDFDLSADLARLRAGHPDTGAVAAFVGTVREFDGDGTVSQLELEHYPGMTEAALEDIVARARRRWEVIDVLVVHRVGALRACEQIVLVAVAARHRAEAFAACEFVMDYLKTRAPFWKKQQTAEGECWVDARELDEAALARWTVAGAAQPLSI
ncbi:molybdenum cofactor biosynthesis protein MoaE [Massilia aerilata]|uniref:Molybdopterin synthase catalytic subunit n=1 Tax=Massilia aerilata TaxID=453817 RepID=A0ABW0RYT1_9BURK